MQQLLVLGTCLLVSAHSLSSCVIITVLALWTFHPLESSESLPPSSSLVSLPRLEASKVVLLLPGVGGGGQNSYVDHLDWIEGISGTPSRRFGHNVLNMFLLFAVSP